MAIRWIPSGLMMAASTTSCATAADSVRNGGHRYGPNLCAKYQQGGDRTATVWQFTVRIPVFRSGPLAPGRHTLRVVNRSTTTILIDGFEVLAPPSSRTRCQDPHVAATAVGQGH